MREAQNRGQGLIVSGCLPQRFREELPKLLPEVDAFMGIDQVAQVTEIVQQALEHRAERLEESKAKAAQSPKSKIVGRFAELDKGAARHATKTKKHSRHRQVWQNRRRRRHACRLRHRSADGCQRAPGLHSGFRHAALSPHAETFRLREDCGRLQSSVQLLHHSAHARLASQPLSRRTSCRKRRQLIADGVKELNLISQDSTYYGLDLRPNHSRNIASPEKFNCRRQVRCRRMPRRFARLLRELNALARRFLDSTALHPSGALDG